MLMEHIGRCDQIFN